MQRTQRTQLVQATQKNNGQHARTEAVSTYF